MVNPREDRQATEQEREDLGPASFLSLIWKASDLGHPREVGHHVFVLFSVLLP